MGAEAIEHLLRTMASTKARGLRLQVGSPAKILDATGAPQDASSTALTRQEVLQLIGPIIPEQARRRLPQETSVEFDYVSAESGAFKVNILRNGAELAVSFVPDPHAASAPAAPAPPPPPSPPMAAAAPRQGPVRSPS